MRSRPATRADADFLNCCAEQSGYPYPNLDDPLIEAVEIVVDSDGRSIMAVAAKRLVELYLYVDPHLKPHQKADALRLLHASMATRLRAKLYTSAECFLPPEIADKFGRRLERSFGWVRNAWRNWSREL